MNLIVTILGGMWLVRIAANILTYVHLWFVKEYRFDRMWIHLHTSQGRRLIFAPWQLPPASPKTVVLVGLCLAVSGASLVLLSWSWWIKLLIIDFLSFPLTAIAILLLKLPTVVYHEILIYKAKKKIRRHKPMKVIGITGSYGKTSTKEYLATILGTRFKVLKTMASKNSPIAIAEVILHKLLPEHEIFVVEMGAYKVGEIARMTKMVRPQIGIITAINAQHQDLFGSLEITMKAKYELIEGLTSERIAIFNIDNSYTRQLSLLARRDACQIWTYGWQTALSGVEAKFKGSEVRSDLRGVEFKVNIGTGQAPVKAGVIGEHQVSNILAALAAATACGMSLQEAAAAAGEIKPVQKVLEVINSSEGVRFINDTFNNNPDAAKAGLAVLAKTKGKKFLVFQPMIELGKYSKTAHEEVGAYAARVCNEIILTNNNFKESFIRGVKQVAPERQVNVFDAVAAADFLRHHAEKADTVLFKGKEAEQILKLLSTK